MSYKSKVKIFGMIVLFLLATKLLANDYELKDIQTIVSEIEQMHASDGDLEAFSQYLTPKQREDIKALGQTLAANQPGINPNWNEVKGTGSFNLDETLERYTTEGSNGDNHSKITQSDVYIFISSSLSEHTIKNLHQEAERIQAHILMRGFIDNSPKKTIEKRNQIFGDKKQGGFDIDPERFDEFGIKAVPAFVVTAPQQQCLGEQCPSPQFDVVYGEMSLDAALTKIANFGSDNIKEAANNSLRQLRGNR